MVVCSVFYGLCLPLMSCSEAGELSVLDMVCGLSVLEAAFQFRKGWISRRADRLTGVNATGFKFIQTSHLLQWSRNRWLMLIKHTMFKSFKPCSHWNTHNDHHTHGDAEMITQGDQSMNVRYIHGGSQALAKKRGTHANIRIHFQIFMYQIMIFWYLKDISRTYQFGYQFLSNSLSFSSVWSVVKITHLF